MILRPTENDAYQRLDAFLASALPDLSRSRLQSLIKAGHVTVGGSAVKPKHPVAAGEAIAVEVPEPEPAEAQPEAIPLSVLYEDDDLIVIDKAAGIVVHPAAGNPDGTLVNALLHHCGGRLSGIGGVARPGIVHRLDKETSGCLVAAKSDPAHRALVEMFAGRTMTKRYLCVVEGKPAAAAGRIENRIGRDPRNRLRMAVVPSGGKDAATEFATRATRHNATLVECNLLTYRTHQIRVHMKCLGCPILGDEIYARPARQQPKTGRLMLHAWRLAFAHPITGQEMQFEAPVPPEFAPWLD